MKICAISSDKPEILCLRLPDMTFTLNISVCK
jgi:hypothetical protein